ncbi:MAG: response regulator [Firmicutes bacterium]|nr:response regulator [Bacillota bacterium]
MKNTITKQFLTTIILIFVLLTLMLCYIFISFYRSSARSINELGISSVNSEASMVESYLNKGMNILQVTAETIDRMSTDGENTDKIHGYMEFMTNRTKESVDENFTGIYGYIDGKYIDGSGWVPPEGYDPTQRDWYKAAVDAKGKTTLVAPYVDAETGEVMLSVSRLLSDKKSVVSLDIRLNEIQNIASRLTMNNMGFGFIIDKTGLVVSHTDESEKGKNYSADGKYGELTKRVFGDSGQRFVMNVGGQKSTVFSRHIMNEWYVVIVVSNSALFHALRMQIAAGALISAMVFGVIVVFCLVSARKLNRYQLKEIQNQVKLDKVNMNIIRSLAFTIDAKDRYTSGHSQRVATYSREIARRMGKSKEDQKIIYYSALLHDVGKIRVPGAIINKPGKLTDEEFDQIRVHPVSGYHILKGIHEDVRIGYGARYHHERYDGNGYPNGLSGENIPEIARIIGVADAYDAMASNRSYRGALPQDLVRKEIEKGKGKQFDPKIADIMLDMMDDDKDYKMCQLKDMAHNILVVDDEIMNIKMVEHILKDVSNITVTGATTKDETMDILEKNDISLIMLDLKMPDIDGFELFGIIREKYSTPVVVMTSDKSIETIRKISDLGIDDYLTKPLNPFVTKEAVYGVINDRRRGI